MDKKVILFDFDGTVMDGSRCVYKALERSCEEVGVPFPAMERLKGFIGPPIWDSMRVAGFTDDIIPEILTVYRRICGYEEMLKGWRFYDGIPEMLTQLRERGYKLFIVSMRSMPSLREVDGVVCFSPFFDGVFGRMDDDDTTDKAVLTERALKSLNVSRDDCVIIGDSIYDEIGAGNAGIDFVAVTYGFGYTDRSEVNGALAVLDSVGELCDYVEKEFPRMDTDKVKNYIILFCEAEMGFFYTMTAYKIAALIMLVAGALIAFLCNRIAAAAVKEDEGKRSKVSWGLKIAGLALVVAAFIMIMNA